MTKPNHTIPGLLKSYQRITRLLGPVFPLWIRRRAKNGKEDPARLNEREGLSSQPRPDGAIIWMHAASVGESQMLMPLIVRISQEYPQISILITTGTLTSAELLAKRLPKQAVHQYAPADHPKAVHNFLDHWRPDLGIFAESELWPNMIFGAKERGIPLILINARMSKKSIARWESKAKKSAQAILNTFSLILAANSETAKGLSRLLSKTIENTGNLKDAAPALDVKAADLKSFKFAVKNRDIWCATSTHAGEEALLLNGLNTVKSERPNSLLLLAPRHPERGDQVENIFKTAGLKTQRRTDNTPPNSDTDVYIFDTIGDLGLVYRLCHITCIGGSLLKGLAGHNPLEASRLETAVITGPHISSFTDTYTELITLGGAQIIEDPKNIGPAVLALMTDKPRRDQLIQSALAYANNRDVVLDNVWDKLLSFIPSKQGVQ